MDASLKSLIPDAVKDSLRPVYHKWLFDQASERLRATPEMAGDELTQVVDKLAHGWNNPWSAWSDFIVAAVEDARARPLPVLECGSGLSTLVLGVTLQATGQSVWSLEHDPEWAERMGEMADEWGLGNVHVLHAPLRSHASFDWYDVEAVELPTRFGTILCDGPPGTTRGGRRGLMPVFHDRIAPGGVILIDDMERTAEQLMAAEWRDATRGELVSLGDRKPFARLALPSNYEVPAEWAVHTPEAFVRSGRASGGTQRASSR